MPHYDTNAYPGRARGRRVSRWHSSAIPGVIMAPSAHRLAAVARDQRRGSGALLGFAERAEDRAVQYQESDESAIPKESGKAVIR